MSHAVEGRLGCCVELGVELVFVRFFMGLRAADCPGMRRLI